MTDEAAFLAAIADNPGDVELRLVYADWLEEQGGRGHELIRVEEEMRQVPVFSDRYWDLKPRRNGLRGQFHSAWLAKLGYVRNYQPVFRHGVPDGWKERWRLVRELIDRWLRRPVSDVGERAQVANAAEAKLGRGLPPSLREWVAFIDELSPHLWFRDGVRIRDRVDDRAVQLVSQTTPAGTRPWVVRHADLAMADPPVHCLVWDDDTNWDCTYGPNATNPGANTLSSFALWHTLASLPRELTSFIWIYHPGIPDKPDPNELLRELRAAFPVRCVFEGQELFEADDLLVRVFPTDHGRTRRLDVKVGRPGPLGGAFAFLEKYREPIPF